MAYHYHLCWTSVLSVCVVVVGVSVLKKTFRENIQSEERHTLGLHTDFISTPTPSNLPFIQPENNSVVSGVKRCCLIDVGNTHSLNPPYSSTQTVLLKHRRLVRAGTKSTGGVSWPYLVIITHTYRLIGTQKLAKINTHHLFLISAEYREETERKPVQTTKMHLLMVPWLVQHQQHRTNVLFQIQRNTRGTQRSCSWQALKTIAHSSLSPWGKLCCYCCILIMVWTCL